MTTILEDLTEYSATILLAEATRHPAPHPQDPAAQRLLDLFREGGINKQP
jgi:hypothetical protein